MYWYVSYVIRKQGNNLRNIFNSVSVDLFCQIFTYKWETHKRANEYFIIVKETTQQDTERL